MSATPVATPLILVPLLPSSAIAACESSVYFTTFFVAVTMLVLRLLPTLVTRWSTFEIVVDSELPTDVTRASTVAMLVLSVPFTFFSCWTLTASVSAAPAATFLSWRSLPIAPNDTAPPTGAAVPPNTGVPPLFAPVLPEPIATWLLSFVCAPAPIATDCVPPARVWVAASYDAPADTPSLVVGLAPPIATERSPLASAE